MKMLAWRGPFISIKSVALVRVAAPSLAGIVVGRELAVIDRSDAIHAVDPAARISGSFAKCGRDPHHERLAETTKAPLAGLDAPRRLSHILIVSINHLPTALQIAQVSSTCRRVRDFEGGAV